MRIWTFSAAPEQLCLQSSANCLPKDKLKIISLLIAPLKPYEPTSSQQVIRGTNYTLSRVRLKVRSQDMLPSGLACSDWIRIGTNPRATNWFTSSRDYRRMEF